MTDRRRPNRKAADTTARLRAMVPAVWPCFDAHHNMNSFCLRGPNADTAAVGTIFSDRYSLTRTMALKA
jgi:hypothetical protein